MFSMRALTMAWVRCTKYWKLSHEGWFGFAAFMICSMFLFESWSTIWFSWSLNSWELALVLVEAEVTKLGMKFNTARRQYWEFFTHWNPGLMALIWELALSSSRKDILNPVSMFVTLGWKHFNITSRNCAFSSGLRIGATVGTSWYWSFKLGFGKISKIGII